MEIRDVTTLGSSSDILPPGVSEPDYTPPLGLMNTTDAKEMPGFFNSAENESHKLQLVYPSLGILMTKGEVSLPKPLFQHPIIEEIINSPTFKSSAFNYDLGSESSGAQLGTKAPVDQPKTKQNDGSELSVERLMSCNARPAPVDLPRVDIVNEVKTAGRFIARDLVRRPSSASRRLLSQRSPGVDFIRQSNRPAVKSMHEKQQNPMSEECRLLDEVGLVKKPPRLVDIAGDYTRTNLISHNSEVNIPTGIITSNHSALTEQQSASFLRRFLRNVADTTLVDSNSKKQYHCKEELAATASDMLENLTFIGEREREEAIAVIAEYWKHRLYRDPLAELCVILPAGDFKNYMGSAHFLFDYILSRFNDDEIKDLGPRIVLDIADITATPEHTSIIFLDDWMISGSQIRETFHNVYSDSIAYLDCFEIQLITSTPDRVKSGLKVHHLGSNNEPLVIPIRSYFESFQAGCDLGYDKHNREGEMAYETGSHSSVDYGFEVILRKMLFGLREWLPRCSFRMPPTTRIERVYQREKFNPQNVKRLDNTRGDGFSRFVSASKYRI